jgi:hypothetical protein
MLELMEHLLVLGLVLGVLGQLVLVLVVGIQLGNQ